MGVGVSVGASPVSQPAAARRRLLSWLSRRQARRAAVRRTIDRWRSRAVAIVAALVLFGVFMAVTGRNPLAVYQEMFRGSFGTWFSFQNTLQRAAPLMLTALATALPLRLGLVMLGGEGAMVLGGLAAAAVGDPLAHAVFGQARRCCWSAGSSAGCWMAGAGALRAYRGVNETISTLLLNYIAIALLNHLVEGPLRDPASLNKPSTLPIGDDNMLGTFPGLDVHWGLGVGAGRVPGALGADAADHVRLRRAHGGRQHPRRAAQRAAGAAADRDRHVPGRAGAGLAGAIEVAAIHGTANASLVTGYGYTGVLVAFIARANPIAVHAGGDPAGRHRRQRRPVAARVRAARRDGQRAAGDAVHLSILFSETLYGRRWFAAQVAIARRRRHERGYGCRSRCDRRRDPDQHAVPVREPGRVPDREERAREPGSRGDAGHGRDVGVRHLVPDRVAVAGRADGRRRGRGAGRAARVAVRPPARQRRRGRHRADAVRRRAGVFPRQAADRTDGAAPAGGVGGLVELVGAGAVGAADQRAVRDRAGDDRAGAASCCGGRAGAS